LGHGEDAVFARDLAKSGSALRSKLELLRQRIAPDFRRLAPFAGGRGRELIDRFLAADPGTVAEDLRRRAVFGLREWRDVGWENAVFEGGQGVLLDQDHGFPPHTTWSTTTDRHARELLAEAGDVETKVVGCIRCVTTRHGAGPLPSHDADLTAKLADPGNPANPWQGPLRVGLFDFALYRYALGVQPVDAVAVSWLDRFPTSWHTAADFCNAVPAGTHPDPTPHPTEARQQEQAARLASYRSKPEHLDRETFLRYLGAPVAIKGFGPTADDRTMEDLW
jgi:adenylosuccinate synthase